MARGTKSWLAVFLVAGGCAHPRGPLVVSSSDPSIKIPATTIADRNHDKSAIPQLIKDLESDDAAVRLYASHALHDLTNRTFGYRFYDSDDERFAAVQRWKQWYAEQQELAAGKTKRATTAATQLP